MFQKKTVDELIRKYGLDFENHSNEALRARNKQDLVSAVNDQSIADRSISLAQIAYFGQAHSHQNWVIIRQNEQIIRHCAQMIYQNEQSALQNEQIISQNAAIIELLQQNSTD